jgi:hypothetical protein
MGGAVRIEVAHDPVAAHIADVAVGGALSFDAPAQLPEGLLRGRQQCEVIRAAAPEHRRRRWRRGPFDDLERRRPSSVMSSVISASKTRA